MKVIVLTMVVLLSGCATITTPDWIDTTDRMDVWQ